MKALFIKYINNEISYDELIQLLTYFEKNSHSKAVEEILLEYFEKDNIIPEIGKLNLSINRVDNWVENNIIRKKSNYFIGKRILAIISAAACLILVIYFFVNLQISLNRDKEFRKISKQVNEQIDQINIYLVDGKRITLSDTLTRLSVSERGLLNSNGKKIISVDPEKPLKLNIPRKKQFELILSDHSKVHLNSVSSLTFYPSNLNRDERKVSLNGEAYFEISHNPQKPFIVNHEDQNVKVLGTEFSIHAYEDDSYIKTTLVRGSVVVQNNFTNEDRIIKPGEQAVLINKKIQVQKIDLEKELAWKEGYFQFHETDLKEILKEISRWYDVDFIYKNDMSSYKLSGRISMKKKLQYVLDLLSSTNTIQFKQEGRRVVVK